MSEDGREVTISDHGSRAAIITLVGKAGWRPVGPIREGKLAGKELEGGDH